MVFGGTEEKCLGEEIEKMGGRFNGPTWREQSEFYMNVMGNNVKKAVKILADALQNSVFYEKDIQVEKEALVRNILRWKVKVMKCFLEWLKTFKKLQMHSFRIIFRATISLTRCFGDCAGDFCC